MLKVSDRLQAGLEYLGAISAPFGFEPPVTLSSRVELARDVVIGAHSYVNGGMIRSRVRIGRFCSIAYGVTLGITSHQTAFASTHPFASRNLDPDFINPYMRPDDSLDEHTELGHDVWIGQNAILLHGRKIGVGAVVAAGAVVTKDVPPYAVAAGIPARIIGYRFGRNKQWIAALMKSEWWNCPMTFLQTLPANDIPTFAARCSEYLQENAPHAYELRTIRDDLPRAT